MPDLTLISLTIELRTDLSTKRQNNLLRSDETKAVYPLFSRKGGCGIIECNIV